MQSRREPYLVIKKDNQEMIDHKIKVLEQIGEKQRNQVSKLMARQSNPRALQTNKERITQELTQPQPKQNKSQTARKRYRCQDYVQRQDLKMRQVERAERVERAPDLDENNYLWNVHKAQTEQDRELQYLKSEQYKKYLQTLMQAHSKEQKVKLIKENRNNNVYLGDKKQYLQSIIKSKQVLPRVNLQFGCVQSQYFEEKDQRSLIQRPTMKLNNRVKSSLNEERRVFHNQEKKVVPIQIKKQQLEQSPIKSYPIFEAPTNRERQSAEITTISPICQTNNNNKIQTPPLKQQKISKRQSVYEEQVKKTKPQNLSNITTHKISGVSKQEMPTYTRSSIKNQTYRKELEYCQRQNITDRKEKKKTSHAYRFKIIEDKANKENQRFPSSSLSHSSQQHNNIYNISFKISHPDELKKQNYPSYRQHQNKLTNPKKKISNNQQYPKITPKKYQPNKQRVHTVYNNLEWSHTTLATKQVDNLSNTKSTSKMSVVSKSKIKR